MLHFIQKFQVVMILILMPIASFATDKKTPPLPKIFETELLAKLNSVIHELNSDEKNLLKDTLSKHPLIIAYTPTEMHIPTPSNIVLTRAYIERKYAEFLEKNWNKEEILKYFVNTLVPSTLHEARHIYEFEKFSCSNSFLESELMGYITEFATVDALAKQFPDQYRNKNAWYLKWKQCGTICLKSALQEPGQYYSEMPSIFKKDAYLKDLKATVQAGKMDVAKIESILKDLCYQKNDDECNKIIEEKKPENYRDLQEIKSWLDASKGLQTCITESDDFLRLNGQMEEFYKNEEKNFNEKYYLPSFGESLKQLQKIETKIETKIDCR